MWANRALRTALYTAIAGACLGLTVSGWTYGYHVTQSDAPPWEGKAESAADLDKAKTDILSMIGARLDRSDRKRLEGEIRGMWAQCSNQVAAKNLELAQTYAAELASLQNDYQSLNNGQQFPLHCP